MEEAIARGPRILALEKEAMEVLEKEVATKVEQNQCRVVLWDDIKHNPPEHLKVSPIAMVPHKSRKFCAILDLSFALKLLDGTKLPAVNESLIKTAPRGVINQHGFCCHELSTCLCRLAQMTRCSWQSGTGGWFLAIGL